MRKQHAVLPVSCCGDAYVRTFYYYWPLFPTAGDAESVLNMVLRRSVLHQHPSDRATGEQVAFSTVDETSV